MALAEEEFPNCSNKKQESHHYHNHTNTWGGNKCSKFENMSNDDK
jgi:hypothetical protein